VHGRCIFRAVDDERLRARWAKSFSIDHTGDGFVSIPTANQGNLLAGGHKQCVHRHVKGDTPSHAGVNRGTAWDDPWCLFWSYNHVAYFRDSSGITHYER
jgi:hypothetical protein